MANVTKENANLILEKYLKDHGISKTFVASKVGITPQAFNRRLRVAKAFDADFAFKVSKVLGISPTIFLSSSYTKSLK
ncbi:helix-turn-helix transcriptional regulator [Lactobacillus paragasseri]|uniref:helix-turn-helix transcriptional regulator n=1 Tax=Lactobacillus paragasseri TaxID=2107999 RepID=UPI0022E978A0|nr:transcriptional regulator [Lactobacillus paragasseri]